MQKLVCVVAALLALPFSAEAATYVANLSSANEVPPNGSMATGHGTLSVEGDILSVSLEFSGLSGPVLAGHIHCCALPGANAGVAVGFAIPMIDSGSFNAIYDLSQVSTYSSSFLLSSGGTWPAARQKLLWAFDNGQAYINLHTVQYPGGEIRGQIEVDNGGVPETASWAMMIFGFGAVGLAMRRRMPALS